MNLDRHLDFPIWSWERQDDSVKLCKIEKRAVYLTAPVAELCCLFAREKLAAEVKSAVHTNVVTLR